MNLTGLVLMHLPDLSVMAAAFRRLRRRPAECRLIVQQDQGRRVFQANCSNWSSRHQVARMY